MWHRILADANWTREGISLSSLSNVSAEAPSMQDFHQHFPVVFTDQSGLLNLCAGMTKCTFNWVNSLALVRQHNKIYAALRSCRI